MKARGFFLKREAHLGLHAQIGLPESGDGSALAEAAGLVELARSGVVGIDQQGGAQSELCGLRHGLGKEGGAHAFAALRRGDGERIDVVFRRPRPSSSMLSTSIPAKAGRRAKVRVRRG